MKSNKQYSSVQDVLNVVVDKEDDKEELLPGFSGIGRLRGRTDYTNEEKTILNHFFTNSHSNVYCARDTMPNELWALLMGQYARSVMTARDRLLKLFENMHEKGEGPSLSELNESISGNKDVLYSLEGCISSAGKFIEKWGVKYGHASLRDSGLIRVCFEGVSQRATKEIESAREGAYQEQSTRALPFGKENLGIPYEIRGTEFEKIMFSLDEKLIDFYERANEKLIGYLTEKYADLRNKTNEKIESLTNEKNKLSDNQWKSIIKAKAFDIARYLLPQNMTTSLGLTLNTRRFQDQLTAWQSHPLLEVQVVGRVAQLESLKISPNLMKYGNPSEYHKKIFIRGLNFNRTFVEPHTTLMPYQHYEPKSTLISSTPDLEDLVLASILLNSSDGSIPFNQLVEFVKKTGDVGRRMIAASSLAEKGQFDIFSKVAEIGSLTFERLFDIGAYRDLQRQRGDRQQKSRYSVVGYSMPKEFTEIGMDEEFIEVMGEVKHTYDLFKSAGQEWASEYVPVMANVIRQIVTMDPIQQFYQAELRTAPAGIDSYRSIANQEIKQTLALLPSFKGLIRYDDKEYLFGRLAETLRDIMKEDFEKKSLVSK